MELVSKSIVFTNKLNVLLVRNASMDQSVNQSNIFISNIRTSQHFTITAGKMSVGKGWKILKCKLMVTPSPSLFVDQQKSKRICTVLTIYQTQCVEM